VGKKKAAHVLVFTSEVYVESRSYVIISPHLGHKFIKLGCYI